MLPTCGQCEKSGTQCVYPQTFKRGFPEGYLAGIEVRLAETERALFETLSILRSAGLSEALSQPVDHVFDFKQTKTARMKEWERLPLATVQDRRNWLLDKAGRLGISLQDNSFRGRAEPTTFGTISSHSDHEFQDPHGNVHTTPWQQAQAGRVDLDQGPYSSPMTRQSPLNHPSYQSQYQSTPNDGSPGWRSGPPERHASVSDPMGASKAEMLSSTQSRKFF